MPLCVASAALCAFLSCPGFTFHAFGASADDYRTPEYLAGRGLEAIHAADAYAQGYSGKGVTVGVLDTVAFPLHQEFHEKTPYPVEYYTSPDTVEWHGVHTAGTIAASRDNAGMHGVAYGANLVSIVGIDETDNVTTIEAILTFRNYPDIAIVSNSWGPSYFSLGSWPWSDKEPAVMDHLKDVAGAMASLAAESGTLFIFAAGNDGHSSPGMPAPLPSWMTGATLIGGQTIAPATGLTLTDEEMRALSLCMISVSAFDPERASDRLDFIAPFSDLTDGAAHYSLLAPGVDIYSSVGPGVYDYTLYRGTSMSAPLVAGVAALVKEAFPWMDGKQVADTLLSTATHPRDMDGLPPFLIQTYRDPDESLFSVTATKAVSGADLTGHEEEISRLWENSGFSRIQSLEEFTEALGKAMDRKSNADPNAQWDSCDPSQPTPVHIITTDQYMALFGMGVVNAGEAVRGPGWLDANRLSEGDQDRYGGFDYAMYPVNTKGYDGVWSHDLGQVKVEDNAKYPSGVPVPAPNRFNSGLTGLDVGLRKQGSGTLTLTGVNTYLGPTAVTGGEISLGIIGQSDGAAQLLGDVFVGPAGIFSGNGTVGGSLDSDGTISPGLIEAPGSALTVQNDVRSSGGLRVAVWNTGQANLLRVGGTADISGTVIELSVMQGGALPASAYEIIRATALIGSPVASSTVTQQGVTLRQTFDLLAGTNALQAVYASSEVLPRSKALSEGFLAGTALVNLGGDLVAGQGISEAVKAAQSGAANGVGLGAFGVLSGGRLRYNTGSHVDMNSLSLLAGLSRGRDFGPGHLTAGAFLEYGNGSYDTYNSFGNAPSVHGDGDIYHIGGGVLVRMDFADTGPGHIYAEASGRAGGVHNEYDGSDLRDTQGRSADYDSSSAYYGFHAGAGYVLEPTDKASLDLYGKYFWTRQEGDSVTLSTGDPVKFEDADSSRLRFGGRFAYAVNEYVSPYLGTAWEHEFAGRTRASTNGFDLDAPSLRGDTGIGEVGLSLRPSQTMPLSFDFGLQGYVGKRKGVTGTLQARLEF
jgi:outer membrane autotransporter protein